MVKPGKICQIIGPVIDVAFEGQMPPVYEKLVVQDTDSVLEVLSDVYKRQALKTGSPFSNCTSKT